MRPFPKVRNQNPARTYASLHIKLLLYKVATRTRSPKSQAMPALPGRRVLVHEHLNGPLILGVHNHLRVVAWPCHGGSLLQSGPLLVI